MTYNGWTNWETCESYLVITSNDEKRYRFILEQLKKTEYLGKRSIKAYIKQHNRDLKKEGLEDLMIDLDKVNVDELYKELKEDLEVA